MSDLLDTPEAGRRVVRGGALRVGGFVVGVLTSLLGAALVTRHLGTAGYGRYQTVVALVTIVQAVTDLGMSALGLREYAQRQGADRDRFMRVLLGMRLALTGVGVSLAAVVAVVLGYDSEMISGAALMGVGTMLGVLASTVGIPLAAELRMGAVTGLDLGRQVLTTLLFVVLVVVGAGIVPFLGVVIVANGLVLIGTLVLLRGHVPLRPSFDRVEWASLVKPTIAFALASAVGSMYVYAALVLTQLVTTPYETGIFSASFRVFAIVAAVPGVLVTTAFPLLSRAARDDLDRLRYATQRLFEGTAMLGGAALLGCVLGAEPIIAVVAGPKFRAAADVLPIQGVALGMTFVIATWGFTLLARHRHRAMVLGNVVALVVSATTVLLLARAHGATGAAFGTLLGETSLAACYLVALIGGDRAMRPRLGRVARALPALGLGLACGLLPLPPVVSTVIGLAVYGLGLLLFGALPNEIREHLPGPLRRLGPAGPGD